MIGSHFRRNMMKATYAAEAGPDMLSSELTFLTYGNLMECRSEGLVPDCAMKFPANQIIAFEVCGTIGRPLRILLLAETQIYDSSHPKESNRPRYAIRKPKWARAHRKALRNTIHLGEIDDSDTPTTLSLTWQHVCGFRSDKGPLSFRLASCSYGPRSRKISTSVSLVDFRKLRAIMRVFVLLSQIEIDQ